MSGSGRATCGFPRLCLGTMMFGDQTDAAESARIMASAREQVAEPWLIPPMCIRKARPSDAGAVAQGATPRLRWPASWATGCIDDPNAQATAHWILQAGLSEDSPGAAVQTDYLDILYLHRDFEKDSLEEALRAIDTLIQHGKIRYWGCRISAAGALPQACAWPTNSGMPRPSVCQPYYNLLNRMPGGRGVARLRPPRAGRRAL
ncbi:MAG: aldo/keto reductase [Burkholderiaceae bacterium]